MACLQALSVFSSFEILLSFYGSNFGGFIFVSIRLLVRVVAGKPVAIPRNSAATLEFCQLAGNNVFNIFAQFFPAPEIFEADLMICRRKFPCNCGRSIPVAPARSIRWAMPEKKVVDVLNRVAQSATFAKLNEGNPWKMGETIGISEEYARARTEELQNVCLWCDEFFDKHFDMEKIAGKTAPDSNDAIESCRKKKREMSRESKGFDKVRKNVKSSLA